jgi:hypothetical protein
MANTLLPIFGRQTLCFNRNRPVTTCLVNYAGRGFRLVIIANNQSQGQII